MAATAGLVAGVEHDHSKRRFPSPLKSFFIPHQYLDDNPSAGTPSDTLGISVTVTDDDGGTGSNSTSILVSNVVPVITGVTGPAGPIALGSPANVVAEYTDVGMRDTHLHIRLG